MMGWQWHQLDHVQIICTSLQTDNQASISPLSFYRPDALPATQPTASEQSCKEKKFKTIKSITVLNIAQKSGPTGGAYSAPQTPWLD